MAHHPPHDRSMTAQPGITHLDCTLRDGGYYTNWMFDDGVVRRYVRAMEEAGVDVIEAGFRMLTRNQFRGPYAHTTDRLLDSLPPRRRARLAVMVNAADLVGFDDGPVAAVDRLFAPAEVSPVDVVRVAAHVHEVEGSVPACERLRALGYEVAVNLMQVSRHPRDDLGRAVASLASADAVDVLYFADSLGTMRGDDVAATVDCLRRAWAGAVGFHAHDNRRLGLANTLDAVRYGCSWVDSTVRGMGRGAGNAATEFLLPELARLTGGTGSVDPLLTTVMVDFAALQQQFGWGPDLMYLKAAEYGVHPTYVQLLASDPRYDLSDGVAAMESLRHTGGHSFSEQTLEAALGAGVDHPHGSWDPHGWLADRDVLLLASGPGASTHAAAIEAFVEEHEPAVLCLNTTAAIAEHLVTAFVVCHPTRVALEAARLGALGRPVVAPRPILEAIGPGVEHIDVRDYGIVVEPGRFQVGPTGCVVPDRLAVAYALAIATRGGARRVLLAGFDGYGAGDPRQDAMQDTLRAFADLVDGPPLIAVTPTTYAVTQSSIYAPEVSWWPAAR